MCFFKEKDRKFQHESLIPALFVLLWILGLILTIINPDIVSYISPNADQIGLKEKTTLNSLICIYFVFVVEIFITFKDIKLVISDRIKYADRNLIKQVNKEFWKFIYHFIIPDVFLSCIILFIYMSVYSKNVILFVFIILSSIIKWFELKLSNSGAKVFEERNILNVLPKKIKLKES